MCPKDLSDYINSLEEDENTLKLAFPESEDACFCASDKLYKDCCQAIFMEIAYALVYAHEGKTHEALTYVDKAKHIVGETAEVLCLQAFVYQDLDKDTSKALLAQCLSVNPKHPRAHFLQGKALEGRGDYEGAIAAYQSAIAYYPPKAHAFLNKAYNCLAQLFHHLGRQEQAKAAFEKALLHWPEDRETQTNLRELIYKEKGIIF